MWRHRGLIEALGHNGMFVRVKAAVSLGRIGDAEALGALKRALKDKDENVRKAAKMAIEDIRL